MTELVKPDTPVTIELANGRSLTLPAAILAKVPTLRAQVKDRQLPDKTKNRLVLDFKKVDLETIVQVLSHACGGPFDVSAVHELPAWGLMDRDKAMAAVIEHLNTFMCLPSREILTKGGDSTGGAAGVSLRSDYVDAVHAQASGNTNNVYTETQATEYPSCSQDNRVATFLLKRSGDMVHTFTLRINLKPRPNGAPYPASAIDDLFDRVEMSIGGMTFDAIDLVSNNTMARARNLWPKLANTPPTNPKENWIVTIPLMFHSTTDHTKAQIPVIGLYFHEIRVTVSGFNAKYCMGSDSALDMDMVYLPRAQRRAVASIGSGKGAPDTTSTPAASTTVADWDTGISQWSEGVPMTTDPKPVAQSVVLPAEQSPAQPDAAPSPKKPLDGKLSFNQYEYVRECLPAGKHEHSIRLQFSLRSTGLMLRLKPSNDDQDVMGMVYNKIPLVHSATLYANNQMKLAMYDADDLAEWNWLKCGMTPPGYSSGNRWQSLLIPFSRSMIKDSDSADEYTSGAGTVALGRMDTITLVLKTDRGLMHQPWDVTVTSMSENVLKYGAGMAALRFTH